MAKTFLSLIIPAYNEENRLPGTLQQVLDFLSTQPYLSEVLVVENGSHDRTLHIAQDFAQRYPQLQVLQSPQRGKGLAVRQGMLAAHGEYRFMCDADLSLPVSEISRYLPPALTDMDIAIASREAPGRGSLPRAHLPPPGWAGLQCDEPPACPAGFAGYPMRVQVLPRGCG